MVHAFGTAQGTRLALRAEIDVGRLALRFLQAGISSDSAKGVDAAFEQFSLVVQTHLMANVMGAHGSEGPLSQEAVALAQAAALERLLGAYHEQAARHRTSLRAPYLGVLPDTDEQAVAAKAGCLPGSAQPQGEDPLQKAYAMTKFNAERIEQRICLLYALNACLPFDQREKVQAAMLQVSNFLWSRHQGQLAHRLALGSLLGGAALEENRALAKKMFGPEQSVLGLTRVDAALPHYYSSSEEAALHLAIANA